MYCACATSFSIFDWLYLMTQVLSGDGKVIIVLIMIALCDVM